MNDLSRKATRLRYLESQIRKGIQDINEGMEAIHREQLYKLEYGSFEDYCRSKWGMSRQHAARLMKHRSILRIIDGSDLSENVPEGEQENSELSSIDTTLKVSHTREVEDLPEEQAAEVLVKSVETAPKDKAGKPKVTAKHVRATREEVVIEANSTPPAKPAKNGTQKVCVASLVDQLVKTHIGPLARGLTAVASANGGEGKQFRSADRSLNELIETMQKMREGQQ